MSEPLSAKLLDNIKKLRSDSQGLRISTDTINWQHLTGFQLKLVLSGLCYRVEDLLRQITEETQHPSNEVTPCQKQLGWTSEKERLLKEGGKETT